MVLAAGGSQRLGRPKQLLTRDGETLVHRAVRLAAATHPRRLLVVLGAHEETIRTQLGDLDCEVVSNSDWSEGLAGSLRLAAMQLRDNICPVLILGCDQPALEAAHLQQLLQGAAQAHSRCAATWHRDAPGIPVVASAELFAAAAQLHGDRGLGAHLAQLPAGSLSLLDAPSLSLDIDTAEDLRAAIDRGLCDPA
ncbi:MAG TPA: nucleotidyltransferase family protein [Lysobacter sp.]